MARGQKCKFRSGFLRRGCGRDAVTDCVYCTSPFCEKHGERGPDYTDVCARKLCSEKLRDLREHTEWRDGAAQSNKRDECAGEECAAAMGQQCALCRLHFCTSHVRPPNYQDRSLLTRAEMGAQDHLIVSAGREPFGRPELFMSPSGPPQLICEHCAGRGKL